MASSWGPSDVIVLLTFTALAGCGGGDSGSAPDAGVDADPRPTRTVTGRMQLHLVPAPGEDVAIDANLSTTQISAFVADTMQTLPGSGSSDGTFVVPNVPEGTYALHVGSRWLVRDSDTVDLSYYLGGRVDARPAVAETNVFMDVGDLAPWNAADWLALYSPSARTIAYNVERDASAGVPAVGATSLTGFTYDLSRAYSPGLPSSAAGDQVWLTQLALRSFGGRPVHTLVRGFAPESFTIDDGGKQSMTGTFVTPAATPLAITWDRPAFDRELRAHSPRDEGDTLSYARVFALPDAAAHGTYASAGELITFDPGFTFDTRSLTTTGWSYGDPYPAAWTRVLELQYFTYQFIGDVYKYGSIVQDADLATVGAAPIAPLLGTPQSVKVNGVDAFAGRTGIGLTPTISWEPPSFGPRPYYYVRVQEVPAVDGLLDRALLETAGTRLTIPPGLLSPGKKYAFSITAKIEGTVDLEANPFGRGLPACYSRVTTAFMTP